MDTSSTGSPAEHSVAWMGSDGWRRHATYTLPSGASALDAVLAAVVMRLNYSGQLAINRPPEDPPGVLARLR